MIDQIGMNSIQFLQLDTNIRTSATSVFNANDAYENTFEDALLDIASKEEENDKKINFISLGAPAGFFLDTSLLSEEDKLDINCCSY